MSIALHTGSSRTATAASLTRLGRVTLAVLAFALAAAGVAFMRTFVFEYFHGDPAALHGLVRTVVSSDSARRHCPSGVLVAARRWRATSDL